ncbi:MAG: cyclodeaminase/cyclohydrolase family protein [Halanaerobium sp.]|nr:cyclodeaminase/cyclohydrolase family protein [Halanaerobium sp.]
MLAEKNLQQFLQETASDKPVPGGGSVAALCAALASSLTAMVANLTQGKKKYLAVNDEMEEIAAKSASLAREFTAFIDKDADAFSDVMRAFRLPKGTEEEKVVRKEAVQQALKGAALTPLGLAEKTAEVFALAGVVIEKGNTNAVTDGAVAVMLARTAILAALYNVEINLASINDREFVRDKQEEVARLRNLAVKKEEELLASVQIS